MDTSIRNFSRKVMFETTVLAIASTKIQPQCEAAIKEIETDTNADHHKSYVGLRYYERINSNNDQIEGSDPGHQASGYLPVQRPLIHHKKTPRPHVVLLANPVDDLHQDKLILVTAGNCNAFSVKERCGDADGIYLRPIRAIQTAVLDGFGDVFGLEVHGVFQVGDGAGYFQDAVVGTRAETLLGHGAFEQALAVCR